MKHLLWTAMLMALAVTATFGAEESMKTHVPEHLYEGDLVNYPAQWAFDLPRAGIIIVRDAELVEMANDPTKEMDLSTTQQKHVDSLKGICEKAQARGARTLIVAFDHFFAQYRPGQYEPRKMTCDTDAFIKYIAKVSQFAAKYGLGLELSMLSPLEIGPAYQKKTKESGIWMHYRKGLRDTQTGRYSVQFWRHTHWANNKGVLAIQPARVRVFAFTQRRVPGTRYLAVDPASIIEITDTARTKVWKDTKATAGNFPAVRVEVSGQGRTDLTTQNRILVVQEYKTPEMDYFSPTASAFLTDLVDRYAAAGVKVNALYADEMHIQQDWNYFNHHDNGTFAMRYVSPGLAKKYTELYGPEYADFAKYLVYFVSGQEDATNDLSAKEDLMHVFGTSVEDIQRTALFRKRYFALLQDGVVDLFANAKKYAEKKMGHLLEARAHATWAESPTIDYWRRDPDSLFQWGYEYTPDFIWSCTVHQAASACHDYFKWGDFLTGNGNDTAECGYLDRNYWGLSLAASTGAINDVPYSYGAHWGMPGAVSHRRSMCAVAYGVVGSPSHWGVPQGGVHRETPVLMLYPLDLVSVDERFGSWMTLYAYANYITQAKLLELGSVVNGAIEVRGRRYTTVCAQFEPFPSRKLMEMLQQMAEEGGRVIWSGPPPVLSAEGQAIGTAWQALFGVRYKPAADPMRAAGAMVRFEGALSGAPEMSILTDFTVDRIYPVDSDAGTEVVARIGDTIVGTRRVLAGGGQAVYLGFRPRDDQAASLGYETRTWIEALTRLGAYTPSGKFAAWNDAPEVVSRSGEYLACRFPNGAVTVVRHLHRLREDWPGGFGRDTQEDAKIEAGLNLPPAELNLQEFRVAGHSITYTGQDGVTILLNEQGDLLGYTGRNTTWLTVDGVRRQVCSAPMATVGWGPVAPERRKAGGAVFQLRSDGSGEVYVPASVLPERFTAWAEGAKPGSKGAQVAVSLNDGKATFTIDGQSAGRWVYVVPAD